MEVLYRWNLALLFLICNCERRLYHTVLDFVCGRPLFLLKFLLYRSILLYCCFIDIEEGSLLIFFKHFGLNRFFERCQGCFQAAYDGFSFLAEINFGDKDSWWWFFCKNLPLNHSHHFKVSSPNCPPQPRFLLLLPSLKVDRERSLLSKLW